MNKLLLIGFAFLLSMGCNKRFVHNAGDHFVYRFQFYLPQDGKLNTLSDSANIYYRGTKIIYEFSYPYVFTKTVLHKTTGNVTVETLIKETRNAYLVTEGRKQVGVWFDSLRAVGKPIPVESTLKERLVKEFQIFETGNDSLVAYRKLSSFQFLETHVFQHKRSETYFDSIHYTFNSKSQLRYSLSPELERQKKAKLEKAKFIYNAAVDKKTNILIPRRTFVFELSSIKERPAIDSILKKYQNIKY